MPTDWEARYQQRDTPWEKGGPHPGLLDWLTTHELKGPILVPGCGTGHDVRALATKTNEVLGLDLAPSALKLAQAFPPAGTERYELGDLFALPKRFQESFDWVFEHTCFCAIDPALRPKYVESIHGVLKPGGQLLAIFYLDPGLPPGESGPPFGVTLAELDTLFSPRFTLQEDFVPTHTYPGREARERLRLYAD